MRDINVVSEGMARLGPGYVASGRSLHEGVVNRDHKDLASLLELRVTDVSGNMAAGAGRA